MGKINSFEDMEKFRKAKGYKFGWTIRKCLELNIVIPKKYSYVIERFYA
jgi:hypothetical protein